MLTADTPCAVYDVVCVPGVRPARGQLLLAPSSRQHLVENDFCRSSGSHTDWLPRHVPFDGSGGSGSSSSQGGGDSSGRTTRRSSPAACHPCPAASLLPNFGVNVDPVASCTRETFSVLQCLPFNNACQQVLYKLYSIWHFIVCIGVVPFGLLICLCTSCFNCPILYFCS